MATQKINKNKFFLLSLLICTTFVLYALSGCGTKQVDPSQTNPQIYVSILPQKYFVERIAGKAFDIKVMIPPGYSPATYEPTPLQMKNLEKASIYFRIGHIAFEKSWIMKIKQLYPRLKIIDTSAGVNVIQGEGEHDQGIDPHIWLSPRRVKIQIQNIKTALSKHYPKYAKELEQNYQSFQADIHSVDSEIRKILAAKTGAHFLVFHPAWSYFAEDYDLEQIPIEIEGKSPTPREMKMAIDIAREKDIKAIFVQKQFDITNAQAIAQEINGTVRQLDPLAENWLANIQAIAKEFSQNLR